MVVQVRFNFFVDFFAVPVQNKLGNFFRSMGKMIIQSTRTF